MDLKTKSYDLIDPIFLLNPCPKEVLKLQK
jgi:hypothetical protein